MLVMFSCFQHSNVEPWRGERAPVLAAVLLYAEMWVWGRGWLVVDALAVLAAPLRCVRMLCARRIEWRLRLLAGELAK